jgi:hypothetical protein
LPGKVCNKIVKVKMLVFKPLALHCSGDCDCGCHVIAESGQERQKMTPLAFNKFIRSEN